MDYEEKEALKGELSDKVKEIGERFTYSSEALDEYLSFAVRFKRYSHKNRMMIYAQRRQASYVAPASAWYAGLPNADGETLSKEKLYIKKGEKAIYIYCPVEYKLYETGGGKKRYSELTDAEKKLVKESPGAITVEKRNGWKLVPVFDVGQVNCPPELLPKILGIGTDDLTASQIYDAVKSYASSELGIDVFEADLKSVSLRGYFDPQQNTIAINSIFKDTQRLSTLIHEVGHVEMRHGISVDETSKNRRELEADMYCLMVEKLCGVETTDTRKAHLANHYREFVLSQAMLDKAERTDISEVFDSVFARYERSAPKLEKAIGDRRAVDRELVPDYDARQRPALQITKI